MENKEWSDIWRYDGLGLNVLHAYFNTHAFPRHSHDYYVIAMVGQGIQSFQCEGNSYETPPDGLIFINPGEVHTGEPVDEHGYELLSIYPTTEHIHMVMADLTGDGVTLPYFVSPRGDNGQAAAELRALYRALRHQQGSLACESRYFLVLSRLIRLFANTHVREFRPGNERRAVRKAMAFIHQNYDQNISLTQLAEHVNLSRYYLIRVFQNEVGMPPHRYLDNVRIQKAQQMIEDGCSLADVARRSGYSSQSHLTQRFKRVIGVTPGRYAQQLH